MTRRLRRYLAAGAIVAALVGVSACDGDGEDPQTTGSETTSVETTTESTTDDVTTDTGPTGEPPEVEAPEVPPEMEADDATGAAAATWYFLELYDYTRASGDTALWEAMVTDDCGWCATVVDQVDQVYADGGYITGEGLSYDISLAEVELPSENPHYVVRLDATEAPFQIVRGDGSVVDREGQALEPLAVGLEYSDGSFRVVGVNFDAA